MVKRQGPTAEDWIKYRAVIESLYLEQGKELKDVASIMSQAYSFAATSVYLCRQTTQESLLTKTLQPQTIHPSIYPMGVAQEHSASDNERYGGNP
jgi:hypothetical protein